jgi:hypothetical protein
MVYCWALIYRLNDTNTDYFVAAFAADCVSFGSNTLRPAPKKKRCGDA